MRTFIIVLVLIGTALSKKNAKNEIFEVPSDSKETKSVIDIKQFVECIKDNKEIAASNFIQVLEHKKGYKKQLDYLKKISPHNKDAILCRKNARKTVPNYLDVEQFAY